MPCATPASRSATWTASSPRASTRPRRSARRSASSPRYVDGTTVGGCSFIIMVGHAMVALHHGLCDVAVVCHGESGRSGVGVTPRRDTALPGQYETPYGFGGAPTYFGMITTRHMHEYGTTLEQWAQVAVSTRAWARAQPEGAQPRAHHRRRRAQLAPGVLPVQPAQHLPRDRRRRRGGADARRPREGLRQEAGLRARRGRGDRARDADPDEEPDPERGHAPVRRQGLRDGRRRPQGLRPHHALRRLHLGAADHARVPRLLQARRGRAASSRTASPRRAARCPSTPMAAASRTRTRACTASSRSSRRCASSAASAARARCRAPSSRS